MRVLVSDTEQLSIILAVGYSSIPSGDSDSFINEFSSVDADASTIFCPVSLVVSFSMAWILIICACCLPCMPCSISCLVYTASLRISEIEAAEPLLIFSSVNKAPQVLAVARQSIAILCCKISRRSLFRRMYPLYCLAKSSGLLCALCNVSWVTIE